MRPIKTTLELARSTLLDVHRRLPDAEDRRACLRVIEELSDALAAHYRRSVELKTVMTCLDRGYYGDVDSDFVADLRGAVGRIDA